MKRKQSPLVSIAACVIVQICVGILYIWSALKTSAVEYYGWNPGDANLVASFMLFAFCGGNFAGGFATDRLGPKKSGIAGVALFGMGILFASFLPKGSSVWLFYLCYCIISGLGSGISYGAMLANIQRWMPHRRGLATGIGTGAFGLSTIVFSPVATALVKQVSFDRALLILALIFLVVGLGAASLIAMPDREYLDSLPRPAGGANLSFAGREDMALSRAIKTLPFWLLFFGIFFFNGTWNMLNPLIKGLGMERGLSESAAIMALSLTGISNTLGRLLLSTMSDKIGRINCMYLIYSLTVVCALLLCFVTGWGFFAAVLLAAFCYGGPAAVNPATATDFFGIKYAGSNYGIIMLALGLSSIVFNYISNALYAATGEYVLTFIMGAVTAAISIVIAFAISRCVKKQKTGA